MREVNGKAMHMASFGALLPKSTEAPVKLSVQRVVEVAAAVEALLSSRKKGATTEYLVKWKVRSLGGGGGGLSGSPTGAPKRALMSPKTRANEPHNGAPTGAPQ